MRRTFIQSHWFRATALPTLASLVFPLAGCTTSAPTEGNQKEDSGFDEVVYVVRQNTVVDGKDVSVVVAGGMGQVMDYGRYVPGARIEVRNVDTKDVRNILEGDQYVAADVEGMDLNFDAKKVVFAMKLDGNDHYHIYTANLAKGDDAKNPYGIAKLTDGLRDDLAPIWLAGGIIAFVTNQPYTATQMGTRADEYNHARAVTQLATITEVGGDADRKLCSQNLSHTFNPFRLKSGQVGYSRWEHLENVNDSKLFAMNPDCTQMIALSGQHGKPANSLVQVVETDEKNVFIAVATNRENTIQAGALVKVDARSKVNDQLHDEERATFDVLTPGVPRDDEGSSVGRYRTPHVLPDGRLLVSWAPGFVNDLNELSLTPPDFGIYIYDAKTRKNELVYNDDKTWELYAQPVAPHDEPPPLSSIQTSQDPSLPVTLGSIDIRNTSLGSIHHNTVSGAQFTDGTSIDDALKAAVKVRIVEGFSTEAAKNVTMFGLTMAEGAAILGEAPVHADGSWRAEIPPFVPVHLQAVDEFDLAIRNQTTWIQGMPGEDRVCGGCHEERTAANAPGGQQLPSAQKPENFMKAIADRTEYPWASAPASTTEIQKILTAKCVSCHNSTTNGSGPQDFYTVTMNNEETGEKTDYKIARLDLSETPVTVTYDRRTASYPSSYVSIFYPAALDMEMGRGAEVTGTKPPKWGVPSDARNSKLIEKLNVTSSIDGAKMAWTLDQPYSDPGVAGGTRKQHPEDVGITLTRAERVALIRAFDMGGQFYSRQNTDFQAYTDGTSGTGTGTDYKNP
jgi:hypothetical protein